MTDPQKALTKKKPFSMLMASGTLINAHAMKKGFRKLSATQPSGIRINSPVIKVDETTGAVLGVKSAHKETPLSADDLLIAADVAAVSAGLAKATMV